VNNIGKVFGIISLLCGILGFFGWILLGSLPMGFFYLPGVAIVFGIIGLFVDDSKGRSIA
jgi:hypothetical protein